MTEAMPFLRTLITFLWPPDIGQGIFCVSRDFDTLLKNAGIFERGCSPLRRTRKARTLVG